MGIFFLALLGYNQHRILYKFKAYIMFIYIYIYIYTLQNDYLNKVNEHIHHLVK